MVGIRLENPKSKDRADKAETKSVYIQCILYNSPIEVKIFKLFIQYPDRVGSRYNLVSVRTISNVLQNGFKL